MNTEIAQAVGELAAQMQAGGCSPRKIGGAMLQRLRALRPGKEQEQALCVDGESVHLFGRVALAAKLRQLGKVGHATELAARPGAGRIAVTLDFGSGAPRVITSSPSRLRVLASALAAMPS